MKQAKSFAVKLPITFPSLITEIILSQHPDIMHPDEIESKKPHPLSLDYKLLVATKDDVLAELMEISKALGETIKVSTERKIHMDNLIKSMTQEATEREEKGGDEEGNPEAEAN
ncbi:envelope-like protein [Trifolium medium]|uniref:Envelope-like protein n=1 Tax=Trifolium medium TaxID=97028 RepID=A0A392R785_9FABA|nr:envelope-like protein [Trifolium medium]